jgi:hypothetical protein
VPALSSHELLYILLPLLSVPLRTHLIKKRNFKSINTESLINDALSVSWQPLSLLNDINEKILYFNSQVTQLYDKHAPLRTIKCNKSNKSWFPIAVKPLIFTRNKMRSLYKITRDDKFLLSSKNYVTKLTNLSKMLIKYSCQMC